MAETQALIGKVVWWNWITTTIFLVGFFTILVFYDLLLRGAQLFWKSACWPISRWMSGTLLSFTRIVTGTQLTVENTESIEADRPLIIVSNHQSLLDIPILICVFSQWRIRFVAKQQLGKWIPYIALNLRATGSALIDRSNPRQAIGQILAVARALKAGDALVIFPEGTRARTGQLKSFKVSGLDVLFRRMPDAQLVLVTVDGSWKFAAHNLLPIPWGTRIRVLVHPPQLVSSFHNGIAAATALQDCTSITLERWRTASQN